MSILAPLLKCVVRVFGLFFGNITKLFFDWEMDLIGRMCLILCGGKSSRMGQNKALLPFIRPSMLEFLIEKYQKIFERVILCCKTEHQESYTQIAQRYGVEILIQEERIYSPMIGLKRGLEFAKEAIFVTSVDCPFVQREHFQSLEREFVQGREIIYAQTPQKSHYLIGIYASSVLPTLRDRIQKEDFKMSDFVQECKSFAVSFEDEESFSNLNTPQEYMMALGKL